MSDSIFSPFNVGSESDVATTMGGLDNLPSYLQRSMPTFDFSNFTGAASQIAQLFPGAQTRPVAAPGLTDLRFTRGFYGPGQDVNPSEFGTSGPGTLFWQRGAGVLNPPPPEQQTPQQDFGAQEQQRQQQEMQQTESALAGLLNMDWSGAYNDRIRAIEAGRNITNFMPNFEYAPSNIFTPTNTNTFTPTFTPTNTNINTFDPTFNPTYSPSTNIDVSPTISPTISPSITQSSDISSTISPTITQSPVISPSITQAPPVTQAPVISPSITQAPTLTQSPVVSPTITQAPSVTQSPSLSQSQSQSLEQSQTQNQQQAQTGGTQIQQQQSQPPPLSTLPGGEEGDTTATTQPPPDTTGGGLDDIPFNADLGRLEEDDTTPAPQPLPLPNIEMVPPEFPLDQLTPEQETVNRLYQELFGREAEPAALDYWDDRLAEGMAPEDLRRDIRAGAQGSDVEALNKTATARTINELYQSLFGRDAEPAAVDYWGQQLNEGTPVTTLIERMAMGAQNTDAGAVQGRDIDNVANEAFVKDAYRTLYGREASPEELNYHTNAMREGMPREQLVNNMFEGAQGRDSDQLTQYREQANQLSNFVTDFANNTRTATNAFGLIPDNLREQFVTELASKQPELFTSLFGDSTKAASDSLGGTLGTLGNAVGIASALASAKGVPDAAGNLVEVFGTKAIADGAGMALASMGVPVAGQVVAAAIMLDSFLSRALGYDSPIQDAVGWLAGIAEDVVGGVGKQVEKATSWIKKRFKFQEGGLVDMPGGMEYNYADYYGGFNNLPQQEVLSPMAFAGGGVVPLMGGGKIAVGPGGGLDDLIPTSINGRRAAALSDGEFVIPADVVSMMGDGSTNAGSRRLYDLVKQIRQEKTGTAKQAGPLPVGKILERTMR